MNESPVRPFAPEGDDYRWTGVEQLRYKEEGGAPFRDVTRQTLFRRPDLRGELRYFEVAPRRSFDARASRARARGHGSARQRHRARRRYRVPGRHVRPGHGAAGDLAPIPGKHRRRLWVFSAWSTPSATSPSSPTRASSSGCEQPGGRGLSRATTRE